MEDMLECYRRHASGRFPISSAFAANAEAFHLIPWKIPRLVPGSSSHLLNNSGVSSSFKTPTFPRLPSPAASFEFMRNE